MLDASTFSEMLDYFQGLEGTQYWVVVPMVLLAGLALLAYGGDWLADGAASLASNFRVEPVVIGITVVSIATSAPELFICLIAGFRDEGDSLVLGNIVGSNLANIALILGIAAVIFPIGGRPRYYFWEIPWLIFATATFVWVCQKDIERYEGIIMIGMMIGYLVVTIRLRSFFMKVLGLIYKILGILKDLDNVRIGYFDELDEVEDRSTHSAWGLVLGGTIALLIGAQFLVDSAQSISMTLEVNQGYIGLTVVAIGTSLPELAAAVAAARKQQTGLIAGNIFGSNLFNMLFVGGVTATASPIEWDGTLKKEIFLMLGVTVLLALVFQRRRDGVLEMGRVAGLLLILFYFGILVYSGINLEAQAQ